jgi:outer membrane protein OmpA-like peptidoglycan-associated protein
MKKTSGIFFILGLALILPATAKAQYYDYAPITPGVEVNLDILGELPDNDDLKPQAAEPVTETPLAAPAQPRVLKPALPQKKPAITPPPVEPEMEPVQETAIPQTKPPRRILKDEEAPETLEEEPRKADRAPSIVPSLEELTLNFDGNICDVDGTGAEKLDNIIAQMKQMPDLRLQVRAYATGEDGTNSSARRISLSRALAVRAYLMDNGIKPIRVDVRALGTETDKTPLDRVDLVFVR